MSDDWADAANDFDEAIRRAKAAGMTKQELLDEVEEQYDQEW